MKILTLKQASSLRKHKQQKFEMCLKIAIVRKLFSKLLFSVLNYEANVFKNYSREILNFQENFRIQNNY